MIANFDSKYFMQDFIIIMSFLLGAGSICGG